MQQARLYRLLACLRYCGHLYWLWEARIALPGIGVFTVQERAARTGRNPANGQEIQIPARKAAKFKTAREIAGAVA